MDAKDSLGQGGPLHFIIMTKLIASTTEAASDSLVTKIKEFKIKEQGREDICTVVTILSGACSLLKLAGKAPHDLVHQPLQIMQTTSDTRI